MALELEKSVKGINASYWKVIGYQYDVLTGTTRSVLGLYVDKKHADSSPRGFLDRSMSGFKGELSIASQYEKWKESRKAPVNSVDADGIVVRDDDGKPAVELREVNEFSYAKDV